MPHKAISAVCLEAEQPLMQQKCLSGSGARLLPNPKVSVQKHLCRRGRNWLCRRGSDGGGVRACCQRSHGRGLDCRERGNGRSRGGGAERGREGPQDCSPVDPRPCSHCTTRHLRGGAAALHAQCTALCISHHAPSIAWQLPRDSVMRDLASSATPSQPCVRKLASPPELNYASVILMLLCSS